MVEHSSTLMFLVLFIVVVFWHARYETLDGFRGRCPTTRQIYGRLEMKNRAVDRAEICSEREKVGNKSYASKGSTLRSYLAHKPPLLKQRLVCLGKGFFSIEKNARGTFSCLSHLILLQLAFLSLFTTSLLNLFQVFLKQNKSKQLINYVANALNNDIPLSVMFKKHPKQKTDPCFWIFKLRHSAQKVCIRVMYNLAVDNKRLVSFRYIDNQLVPNNISVLRLAQAGFSYSGTGNLVTCQGCSKAVDIQKFSEGVGMKEPSESQFHEINCDYVQKENIKFIETIIQFPSNPKLQISDDETKQCHNVLIQSEKTDVKLIDSIDPVIANTAPTHVEERLPPSPVAQRSYSPEGSSRPSDQQTTNSGACLIELNNFISESIQMKTPDLIRQQPISRIECVKNPGHFCYIPIENLTLEHIPSQARHTLVLEFLQLFATLVVRVVVSVGREEVKVATGSVSLTDHAEISVCPAGQQEKWGTVRRLIRKQKERIYIETSKDVASLITEDAEVSVEFFYNLPSRKGIKVIKMRSVQDSTDGTSLLVCESTDHQFVKQINRSRQQVQELAERLPQRAKECLNKKVFLIHHPHGKEKVLSCGDSVIVKYKTVTSVINGRAVTKLAKISSYPQTPPEEGSIFKALLYAADTCPGTSGAPVLTFNSSSLNHESAYSLEVWCHKGVDIHHSLSGSELKKVTESEMRSSTQTNTRPQSPPTQYDAVGEDVTSLGNQEVKCPVFKVQSPPSYPVYTVYHVRLASYEGKWEHYHIHKPEDLALAGFFYAGYSDCVRCFQCGLGLRSWKTGDIIDVEHRKHRPDCPFLKTRSAAMPLANMEFKENVDLKPQDVLESKEKETMEAPISQILTQPTTLPVQKPQAQVYTALGSLPAPGALTNEKMLNVKPTLKDASTHEKSKNTTLNILENENQKLREKLICKVCNVAPIKDLFLPCGELYACSECSKLLTHCPSCKKPILATVNTFLT
ncbi:uncharacterized protein LOC131940015 isoform X2 [Physella acuta]|uniref:uncharacterized protein LOC131940015 isoform X2 n=1 Tax=Physella acuta TaxID=109671 RepID=UPI0027DE95EE|nr:uncharacterized protein LOC131940015 isoform X2 [Physella acuta]